MRARLLLLPAALLTIVLSVLLASRARRATAATSLPHVTFATAPGSSVLVHGTYPHHPSPCVRPSTALFHERLSGTVEVGKASDGTLFVIAAGKGTCLAVLTSADPNVGLIAYEMAMLVRRMGKYLDAEPRFPDHEIAAE